MVFSFWSNWKIGRYIAGVGCRQDCFVQTAIHFQTISMNESPEFTTRRIFLLDFFSFVRGDITFKSILFENYCHLIKTSVSNWDSRVSCDNTSTITPVAGTPVCRRICAGWYCHLWLAPRFPDTPSQALQRPLKFSKKITKDEWLIKQVSYNQVEFGFPLKIHLKGKDMCFIKINIIE